MTNLINNVNHGNSTRTNAIDNNSNVNYATKAGDGNRSIKCTHVIQDFLTYLSLKQHLRICVKKTKKASAIRSQSEEREKNREKKCARSFKNY